MKRQLKLKLVVDGDDCPIESVPLEMICICGTPTADPTQPELPLTIKEIIINNRPLDYGERRLILECFGAQRLLSLCLGVN